MISSLVIVYINQYVRLSRSNYRLERLESQRSQLKNHNIHLELQISQLKSLDRVEEIAKRDLGMVRPDKINYIVLDRGSTEDVVLAEVDDTPPEEARNIRDRIANFFDSLTEVQAGS